MVATWDPERKVTNDHILPYVDSHDPLTPEASRAGLRTLPYERNVFKLLANAPVFFPSFMKVLGICFSSDKATRPADWQLIPLLTSRILNAPYVWDVNEPIAKLLPSFQPWSTYSPLIAARDLSSDHFTDRHRLISKFCHEIHSQENRVSDETMKNLHDNGFSAAQITELFMLTGIYGTLARMMVSAKIDFDEPIPGIEDMLKKSFAKEIERDQRFLDEDRSTQ